MNKDRVLFVFVVLELFLFVASMFVNINGFMLNKLWFSFALLFVALYGGLYYYLYKLDSSLYFFVLLLCFALTTAFRFVYNIKFSIFYPAYIFCFAVAHFSTYAKFRQNIHIKVFAILALEGILLVSYKNSVLPLYIVVGINVGFLLLVLINTTIRLWKNLRRE